MIKEDIKILTDYMLELNNDIQSAEEWANTSAAEEMYWAIKNVLEYMEKIEKENEELKIKNNTIKNENELEVGIDCNWDALQKVLDEAEKTNEYIIYDNEKWIKEKYCIPVQKIKDIIKKLQKTNFNDYTKEQDGNEVKTKILYEFKKLLEGEE